MHKKITITGANSVFFIVLILFLAFSYVQEFISYAAGKDLAIDYFGLTLLVTQYGLILAPVLIYAAVKNINIKEAFRFRKPGFIPAVIIILAAFPAIFVAGMLNSIIMFGLQFIGDVPPVSIPIPKNLSELGANIVLIAVTPAICEEILHRGLLLKAYENRGSIKAVIITSLLFGVFHFDVTNLLGPIFLGLIIGYYVIRTNSIFAGMLAHFSNNAISIVWGYITREETERMKTTISLQELGSIVIWGIGGLIILYMLLKLFKRTTEGKATMEFSSSSIKEDFALALSHWTMIVILALYVLMVVMYILQAGQARL